MVLLFIGFCNPPDALWIALFFEVWTQGVDNTGLGLEINKP